RQRLVALGPPGLAVGDVPGERGADGPATPDGMCSVPVDATREEIRGSARQTGHLRLLVLDGTEIVGVVHARDAIEAGRDATARELMRESLSLEHDLTVADAFRRMREARAHLVVVEQSQNPGGTDA